MLKIIETISVILLCLSGAFVGAAIGLAIIKVIL